MLGLDSPRWSELQHVFGSASAVPALLTELWNSRVSVTSAGQPEPEQAWNTLWAVLCDYGYGPVHTASYAAVPHLVGITARWPPTQRMPFIHLVASIEAWRGNGEAPPIPEFLETAYFDALKAMRKLAWQSIEAPLRDENDARILMGAMALMDGFVGYGNAVMQLDPGGEVCHECGARVRARGYWSNEPPIDLSSHHAVQG